MTVYFHEEDLPEGVLAPGPIAVDTETMGLQLPRDRLCVVQISDGHGDEQKDYAASDVRFLHALKEKLDIRLEREGRTALAQACFDFLPSRAALDLAGWAEQDIFAHV